MSTQRDDAISLHRLLKGKIEIESRISPEVLFEGEEKGILGLIYTPNVSYVAAEISKNKELAYDYTSKWNNVAIVCDGTEYWVLEILDQTELFLLWKANQFYSKCWVAST